VAPVERQLVVDDRDRMPARDAEPEVPVLAAVRGERRVEAAHLVEAGAAHDDRREDQDVAAHEAREGVASERAWRLPDGERTPGGVDEARDRVAEARRRVRGERRDLARELLRTPEVVGIEECDEPSGRRGDAAVPRGGRSARACRM
jgi:hypothetical protein